MPKAKKIDCITFFDNNFMFEIRYNILKDYMDLFVICESLYDHKNNFKKKNFIWNNLYDKNKIKYILMDKPFPKNNNPWENQAIQREFLLKSLDFTYNDDYIFFSDPDEIPRPELLQKFELKKKYGIFLQDCFNYKFNIFNKHESPWEGTRVAKKKNLLSIDYMRQKILAKNLKYNFFRFDKEKNIELFSNAGWHFTDVMPINKISLKLKTFAHSEYAPEKYSSCDSIKYKIDNLEDLFERGHKYEIVNLDERFPRFILENKKKYKEFII